MPIPYCLRRITPPGIATPTHPQTKASMRTKSMADATSYLLPTRELYRTQTADFLTRYIEWFKPL